MVTPSYANGATPNTKLNVDKLENVTSLHLKACQLSEKLAISTSSPI